jgi:hypothetical protein
MREGERQFITQRGGEAVLKKYPVVTEDGIDFGPAEEKARQYITQRMVRDVLKKYPGLIGRETVRQQLNGDLVELSCLGRGNISALEVINSVSEASTVDEIAETVSEVCQEPRAAALPATGKICRYLSGIEDPKWGDWNSFEIISIEKENSMENWGVELNMYGELIDDILTREKIVVAKASEIEDWFEDFSEVSIPDEYMEELVQSAQ